jgi:hypothetical protein
MFETMPLALRIDSHGDGPVPIFIVFILIAIGLAIFGYFQEKKRREALHAVAMQLGFSFSPENDHAFAEQYGFLNHMDDGSDRYAYNIMQGTAADGSPCSIFDYHYETYSTDSKGRRTTHHHYYSIFTLILPRSFP